jgi:CBS domain-containing protein
MFELPIREVMERNFLLIAPPETSVSCAAKLMADRNVGAVVVAENEHLLGIFTERDLVFRVVAEGRDPTMTPICDVMTASPKSLSAEKSYGHALVMMQENGFRHVPVIENDRVVGVITARNALDPDLEEFVWEERRREYLQR